MNQLHQSIIDLNTLLWSYPLLILLTFVGLLYTYKLRALQFRLLPFSFKLAFSPSKEEKSSGDISQFQALMTQLAAAIGTGNIAGIATALMAGGVGALFWMWVIALLGMATKYVEAFLAVKYRVVDKNGEMSGGPMYYFDLGLGWKKAALVYAVIGAIGAFGHACAYRAHCLLVHGRLGDQRLAAFGLKNARAGGE